MKMIISHVNNISCVYIPCTQTRYCLANNDALVNLIKMLWVHVFINIFLVLYTNHIMYGLYDNIVYTALKVHCHGFRKTNIYTTLTVLKIIAKLFKLSCSNYLALCTTHILRCVLIGILFIHVLWYVLIYREKCDSGILNVNV